MLNTKKLLYILPDLAYVAELLPGKKEYTFSIQSFRQINGEFLSENEILPASIEKLFSKLEEEEYHLILPDFLFTNTIVNVEGTSKTAVLEHVEKKLLPDLKLSKDKYQIKTNVLTSFKGNSKVQISAIEKSVLSPIRAVAQKSKAKIKAISPLSWSIKAIISLEPSISVLQMGSNIYAAQHYIGVDQASNFPLDKYDSIVETIKTLKGAEPSIQSVYLVSSALVEEDIKDKLSDTLPIQQLASFKEDDSKMPSYIKFIIESTMRTLSIPDFPVPNFELGKASKEELESVTSNISKNDTKNTKTEDLPEPTKVKEATPKSEIETKSKTKETVSKDTKENSKKVEPAPTDLPTPAVVPAATVADIDTESTPMPKAKDDQKIESIEPLKDDVKKTDETKTKDLVKEDTVKDEELPSIPSLDTKPTEDEEPDKEKQDSEPTKEESKTKHTADTLDSEEKSNDIDLSKFASKDTETDKKEENDLAVEKNQDDVPNTTSKPTQPIKSLNKPNKKIIKNSSGVNNMLKMVFITIAVFFITIAIGVGVGLGLLKMSDNKAEDTTPTIVTETPTPEATPEPTPELVEVNKDELSILVVNATTKAGYAGKIKALLVDAEIENIDASNAKGDYEEGTDYLLMLEENEALQILLEESTELTFEYLTDIDIEDPAEDYDAVIVLAK